MLRRSLLVAFLLAAAAGAVVAGVACTDDNTAVGITPITGIAIRADSLVAGYGCGTNADQIYKYAAIVTYAGDAGPIGFEGGVPSLFVGLFDCYADGVFSNLPSSPLGDQSFNLSVFAYNQATYAAADANGRFELEVDSDPEQFASDVSTTSTWMTSCTATQQANVEVLAVCGPVIVNPLAPPTPDGGVDGGVDGASDANVDGNVDGASETGDDGSADVAADAPNDAPSDGDDAGDDSGDGS